MENVVARKMLQGVCAAGLHSSNISQLGEIQHSFLGVCHLVQVSPLRVALGCVFLHSTSQPKLAIHNNHNNIVHLGLSRTLSRSMGHWGYMSEQEW